MMAATGLATGLVLTGGGAYIAHTLAESKARGVTQFVMVICWFLLLVFSVILLAPLMVASIRVSPLQSVFTSNISQWVWGITAVTSDRGYRGRGHGGLRTGREEPGRGSSGQDQRRIHSHWRTAQTIRDADCASATAFHRIPGARISGKSGC